MKLFELLRRSFVILMLSFMAIGMLGACSSSEESSSSGGGGGDAGKDCAEQCASQPDVNQDECIILCEGET